MWSSDRHPRVRGQFYRTYVRLIHVGIIPVLCRCGCKEKSRCSLASVSVLKLAELIGGQFIINGWYVQCGLFRVQTVFQTLGSDCQCNVLAAKALSLTNILQK